jgi:uncharacterized membrane-anchored protein YhcB (DUF1043 family)
VSSQPTEFGSVSAVMAATAEVRDAMNTAYQQVYQARARLTEAVALLAELSQHHSTSLLPPEHRKADEQLADGMTLLAGSLAYIDLFVAGL